MSNMDLLAQFRDANPTFFNTIFLPEYCGSRKYTGVINLLGLRGASREWYGWVPGIRDVLPLVTAENVEAATGKLSDFVASGEVDEFAFTLTSIFRKLKCAQTHDVFMREMFWRRDHAFHLHSYVRLGCD